MSSVDVDLRRQADVPEVSLSALAGSSPTLVGPLTDPTARRHHQWRGRHRQDVPPRRVCQSPGVRFSVRPDGAVPPSKIRRRNLGKIVGSPVVAKPVRTLAALDRPAAHVDDVYRVHREPSVPRPRRRRTHRVYVLRILCCGSYPNLHPPRLPVKRILLLLRAPRPGSASRTLPSRPKRSAGCSTSSTGCKTYAGHSGIRVGKHASPSTSLGAVERRPVHSTSALRFSSRQCERCPTARTGRSLGEPAIRGGR